MGTATKKRRAPKRKPAAKRTRAKASPVAKPATALVLRTCKADMTSHGGFRWPESGPVECPDFQPTAECGHGLHGLLWGEGDGGLIDWTERARWLVVEVDAATVVDLNGKVKFPRGTVVHCGDRSSATDYLYEHGALGRAVTGGTATAGYGGTATAGDAGTATAGYGGALVIRWWNRTAERYQLSCAIVGENGIKPHAPYRLDDAGKFVEVDSAGKAGGA
jgi:hypothetical protein